MFDVYIPGDVIDRKYLKHEKSLRIDNLEYHLHIPVDLSLRLLDNKHLAIKLIRPNKKHTK